MKRRLAILLVMCLVFTFIATACNKDDDTPSASSSSSGSQESSAPPSSSTSASTAPSESKGPTDILEDEQHESVRDTLTMAITQDVGTLNPLYLNGWKSQQCIRAIYEPLWSMDELRRDLKYVLATGYEMNEDGLIWTVHLRDDVYFSSGHKLTAEDVIFSLYLANHREGEPPWFQYMLDDENVAINDTTVEFHFSKFLIGYENSFTSVMIFCKETYDPDTIDMDTDGTGPYGVVDYIVQSHLTLKARPEYWGPTPPIENVVFRFMSEDAQRVNAMQAGEIDVSDCPFPDIEYVEGLPNMSVHFAPRYEERAVFCNNTNPDSPFYNNLDARKAVFYAVNPEPILRIAYNGYGAIAQGPYQFDSEGANPADLNIGPYAPGVGYNPDLAKELAESSGLAEWSQNNSLRLINNGTQDLVTSSELVQEMLAQIGVKVEILSYDPGSWLSYRFDHTSYEMTVDFTGSSTAATDLGMWWQYCGNNSQSSGNPDPEDTIRLRELSSGELKDPNDLTVMIPIIDENGNKMKPLGEIADPVLRASYVSEMSAILNEIFLFKNLVNLVHAIGYNNDLHIEFMNSSWVDLLQTYWMS
ncbi:MAG: ABC transporter substrate-binding protein [Oscillospiraceae bacterium]|nr:ABC transporter substrate-binding protein [Oscillospiraceae bacterium]